MVGPSLVSRYSALQNRELHSELTNTHYDFVCFSIRCIVYRISIDNNFPVLTGSNFSYHLKLYIYKTSIKIYVISNINYFNILLYLHILYLNFC